MDESTICSGLIRWLETFPGMSGLTVAGLADGVVMGRVLCIIDSNHFTSAWVGRLKQDCGENWRLKVSNLRKIQQTVVDYLQFLNVQYAGQTLPDLTEIGENACPEEVGRMLQLVLACAMNCPDKKRYIQSIMGMPADVQAVVMNTLQTVFMREASPGVEMTGPASFHPNQRTIAEQLETTTKARDEAVARVHELESQYADVCEKRKYLTEDNARLLERLEGLEDTGEGSTVTTSRYKDLKKKIDSLQDDLFKVETSRDEYRSRVVALEREHGEMVSRTEELQRLADQAHTLQDEVDVLRDMGHRASQAETTIESYKKKLEELSDLRRQHKILEEKNADYMQHILELEEDVKKNDSWRPQLELFKKQVNELRSQLSDETKKADRQSFDNKKLVEKVDAVTIEKDRIAVEREGLKEQLDDLRCQRSAKMTDLGGDISADMLSTDQHQMWEKLMRLQHENERLKKQQRQGAESSEPVLEAMYSELKDQHETVTVENRCEAPPSHHHHFPLHHPSLLPLSPSPPRTPTPEMHRHHQPSSSPSSSCSPSMGSRSSSMAFFDAYVNLDTPKKLRMLRRNLKWASESDLLILRQPSLLSSLLASFSSSTKSNSPGNHKNDCKVNKLVSPSSDDRTVALSKSLSRPDRPRPYSDGSQHIVIRHIHEFKLPTSSTSSGPGSTEDSGCCRTSPSSCDGCEDRAGILDSGVGMCGTLDSGVYECVSPMIPAIVEDYTAHHLSDVILPASSAGPTSLTSNYSSLSSCSSFHHQTHCCHCTSSNSNSHINSNSRCCHGSNGLSPFRRRGESVSPVRLSRSHRHGNHHSNSNKLLSRSSCNGPNSCITYDVKNQSTSGVSSTCSSPARRSMVRNSLPPDSPTPHNSPRIPTRVSATRSRSSRSSKSPSQSSYSSSMSESEPPLTQGQWRPCLQRSQSETDRPSLTLSQKIRNSNRNFFSSSNESLRNTKRSPTPDATHRIQQLELNRSAYNTKESLTTPTASNLVKFQASISADHIPSDNVEEIKVCQSISGLEITPKSRTVGMTSPFSKPVSVVRGVASAIRHPVAAPCFSSISNPNLSSSSISQNVAPNSRTPTNADMICNKYALLNKIVDVTPPDKKQAVATVQHGPSRIIIQRSCNDALFQNDNNLVNESFPSLVRYNLHDKSPTPPMPTRGYFNLETHFGMHDMSDDGEPVTVLRPTTSKSSLNTNRVSFKVPESIQIDRRSSRSSLPPTLMNEPLTGTKATQFRRSASMRVSSKTSTPINSRTDVTLHKSDTLFTHFVESPLNAAFVVKTTTPDTALSSRSVEQNSKFQHVASRYTKNKDKLLPYNIESDSDEDIVEHRLVAGAYGAPLVSSESCTSVSHDDNNDTDPSATEYNTDNGSDTYDFTPHLFRLNYDELQKDKQMLLQQEYPYQLIQQEQQQQTYHNSSPGKISVPRRNSLSRIQEEEVLLTKTPRVHCAYACSPYKLKKQATFLKCSSLTGIQKKKKKHKTAKMVAAETFNAMFTFCTP